VFDASCPLLSVAQDVKMKALPIIAAEITTRFITSPPLV
jgi:hypothetical protein